MRGVFAGLLGTEGPARAEAANVRVYEVKVVQVIDEHPDTEHVTASRIDILDTVHHCKGLSGVNLGQADASIGAWQMGTGAGHDAADVAHQDDIFASVIREIEQGMLPDESMQRSTMSKLDSEVPHAAPALGDPGSASQALTAAPVSLIDAGAATRTAIFNAARLVWLKTRRSLAGQANASVDAADGHRGGRECCRRRASR